MDDELKETNCFIMFSCSKNRPEHECVYFASEDRYLATRCKYLVSAHTRYCTSKVATVNAATLYIKQQTEGAK